MFLYLNFEENSKDFEIYKLVLEVFGSDGHYFEDYKEEYESFVAKQFMNHLNENPTDDFLIESKEKYNELDLVKNSFVNEDFLRKTLILLSSDSIDEYTTGCLELENISLLKENQKLKKNNRSLKNKNKKLNAKLKKANKLNKEILSSSSWRITKPLRDFRRLFKR